MMIKLLTFASLFVLQLNSVAYADFWDFIKPTPSGPQFAVEDTHVANAKCLAPRKSSSSYIDYLDKFKTGRILKTVTISKKKYKDQPAKMVELYHALTGYRSYRKDDYCVNVKCEIQLLFGESMANKLAQLYSEYHFNASHLAHKKASAFRERELDTIIYSFQQLPKFMFENKKRKLIRDTKEYKGAYANVAGFTEDGTGHITFFNKWARSSRSTKVYTVIHEFAHLMGGRLGIDSSYAWAKLSNWHNHRSQGANDSSAIVSSYGRGNPDEDFAETFSAYRFNPELLRSRSIEKYNLLKEVVFQGIEYRDNYCESSDIETNFSNDNLDDSAVLKECNLQITSFVLGLRTKESALACVVDNVSKLKLKEFKTGNSIHKAEIKKNFDKKSYPWISDEVIQNYLDGVDEQLENTLLD